LYLFDTGITNVVYNHPEHRLHLAELVQRTKYFVVDVAKADRIEQSGAQPEIGTRYFEGAAGGAVLVGVAPPTEAFSRLFGWDNAVVPVPDTPAAVAALFDELDANTEAVQAIRRSNVLNSLRRHDSVYRWEQVLRTVGMEPQPALYERKRRLEERAKSIENCGRA